MADRLTQLQDCLDDLLTQMYASLSYIRQRHPYGSIEGQPSQAPQRAQASSPTRQNQQPALTNGDSTGQQQQATQNQNPRERPPTPPPEDPQTFNSALHELARDLVIKEQQIEYIINNLPGIGTSEADQEKRVRDLEAELREVEAERARAEIKREALVDGLGKVIVGVKRVP